MPAAEPIGDDELGALFRPLLGRRLALAVSGGVDSMVLLHLVARWMATDAPGRDLASTDPAAPVSAVGLPSRRPAFAARAEWVVGGDKRALDRNASAPVVVLTVDHGLRADSADDAAFVADEARHLGLPVQILRWEHRAGLPGDDAAVALPTSRVQERAREARYALLADAIEDEVWSSLEDGTHLGHPLGAASDKRAIVTAHHRDDQIETFLMRLQRGAGLDGLAAMRTVETFRRPPTAERKYLSCVDVCRPLLAVSKERLRATARQLGIAWREDRSNDDLRFERARLRRDAPRLDELGYGEAALERSIRRLQSAREAVEHEVGLWMHGDIQRKGIFRAHAGLFGEIGLHADADRNPPPYLLLAMMRRAIVAWGRDEPELSQLEGLVDDVTTAAATSSRFARTLAGCRIDLVADAVDPNMRRMRIWRETGRHPLPEIVLEPGDGGWWDDRFAISIAARALTPVTVRALGPEGVAELKSRAGLSSVAGTTPPGAFATLPAIWRENVLVTVPRIENFASSDRFWPTHQEEEFCGAHFAPVAEL